MSTQQIPNVHRDTIAPPTHDGTHADAVVNVSVSPGRDPVMIVRRGEPPAVAYDEAPDSSCFLG